MNSTKLLEFILGDVLVAAIISGVFLLLGNRSNQKSEQQNERKLSEIKDHIDIRMEQVKLEIKNYILESKERDDK